MADLCLYLWKGKFSSSYGVLTIISSRKGAELFYLHYVVHIDPIFCLMVENYCEINWEVAIRQFNTKGGKCCKCVLAQ